MENWREYKTASTSGGVPFFGDDEEVKNLVRELGEAVLELGATRAVRAPEFKARKIAHILHKMPVGDMSRPGRQLLGRVLKVVGERAIPVLGWGLLLTDIFQLADEYYFAPTAAHNRNEFVAGIKELITWIRVGSPGTQGPKRAQKRAQDREAARRLSVRSPANKL